MGQVEVLVRATIVWCYIRMERAGFLVVKSGVKLGLFGFVFSVVFLGRLHVSLLAVMDYLL